MTEINQFDSNGERHGLWKEYSGYAAEELYQITYKHGLPHGLQFSKGKMGIRYRVNFVNGFREGEALFNEGLKGINFYI